MRSPAALRFWTVASVGFCLTIVLQTTFGVVAASATTLIMPDREALVGTPVVIWGNTTQANGTADSIDCGNGTVVPGPTVTDQSYIATTCTYAAAGTFNAVLTVGAETATAVITVRDPATLTPFDLRNTKVNMAIEDGLRAIYYNQFNRAATFGTNQTSWTSSSGGNNQTNSFTALSVLAIQNHGHTVASPATDIFQPVVQRGLNWLFDKLIQRDMTPCSEGGAVPALNPCIGVAAQNNIGLSAPQDGDDGYATPIFAAAIAAATAVAPANTVAAGLGSGSSGFVAGKTYSDVLQRVVNAVSWGQSDGPNYFGWYYDLQQSNASDGSTMGWAMLGIENGSAAGALLPAEVRSRLATTLTQQLNNNGSLDYQADGDPTSTSSNPAKTGIGLQALSVTGVGAADPRVTAAIAYITRNWNATVDPIDFFCSGGSPTTTNKGCGYAMFNIFKGLRLYGVQVLPGIGRPAGPGPIPADDWYADYVDNLLANQHNPTSTTGGEWSTAAPAMGWSCCDSDQNGITALAELILAPTAFVAPATLTLTPAAATNPVGTNHTVTATATTGAGAPAPGAVVAFSVLSGPNAGAIVCSETGASTNSTNANGVASCTYHDNGGAGTDQIQASVGTLLSNVVTKTWGGVVAPTNIPTLSQWAQILMAALLLLVGVWALRRRKG
jgi:hypothetical protein